MLRQKKALTVAAVLTSRHLNLIYFRNNSFPSEQGVMLFPRAENTRSFQ